MSPPFAVRAGFCFVDGSQKLVAAQCIQTAPIEEAIVVAVYARIELIVAA
jgi:hypothetical protein